MGSFPFWKGRKKARRQTAFPMPKDAPAAWEAFISVLSAARERACVWTCGNMVIPTRIKLQKPGVPSRATCRSCPKKQPKEKRRVLSMHLNSTELLCSSSCKAQVAVSKHAPRWASESLIKQLNFAQPVPYSPIIFLNTQMLPVQATAGPA